MGLSHEAIGYNLSGMRATMKITKKKTTNSPMSRKYIVQTKEISTMYLISTTSKVYSADLQKAQIFDECEVLDYCNSGCMVVEVEMQ